MVLYKWMIVWGFLKDLEENFKKPSFFDELDIIRYYVIKVVIKIEIIIINNSKVSYDRFTLEISVVQVVIIVDVAFEYIKWQMIFISPIIEGCEVIL